MNKCDVSLQFNSRARVTNSIQHVSIVSGIIAETYVFFDAYGESYLAGIDVPVLGQLIQGSKPVLPCQVCHALWGLC